MGMLVQVIFVKYNLFLQFKDCRFRAKALKLLEGKIGEG